MLVIFCFALAFGADFRRLSLTPADYTVTTYAGAAGSTGNTNHATSPTTARFNTPKGLVVSTAGKIYVADESNGKIRQIDTANSDAVTDLSTVGANPTNLVLNSAEDTLYVTTNSAIYSVAVSDGTSTLFAGHVSATGSTDDTGASARFNGLNGVAIASDGSYLLATDGSNHIIRKITVPGAVVTTVAGAAGTTGTTDNTGTNARFNTPTQIALDLSDNAYILDNGGDTLRKMTADPNYVVSTVAGSGSQGSADGTGTAATLNTPTAITRDPVSGNFVFGGAGKKIRVYDPSDDAVDTLACDGTDATTDGTGANCQIPTPYGIAVVRTTGSNIAIYITANSAIRKITGPSAGAALPTPAPTSALPDDHTMGGGTTTLDLADVVEYPNTNDYYKDRVGNSTAQNINRGLHPDYYLGHIGCPGRTVCKEAWIGNGYCDDCFGCDQYMVATGFYGDCSTCAYFWSGGNVGVGEFDGGDCGDFVFPVAVNTAFLDQCLNKTGIRNYTQLATMQYAQKRNTVITELNLGGWGDVTDLQEDTDLTLASKCEYVNIKQCLVKNGWYASTMGSDTVGDMQYTATSYIDDLTTYSSFQLTQMTDLELLEQCVLAGLTQAMISVAWATDAEATTMTSNEKRDRAIGGLSDLGFGTIAQLQTLHNAQLRFLMDHLTGSGLSPDSHTW